MMLHLNECVLAKFLIRVFSELPTVEGILHMQMICVAGDLADE